jgi:uncharacterized membrane protein YkoI
VEYLRKNGTPKMVDGNHRKGVVGRKLYGKQRLQGGCRATDDDDDHHHHQQQQQQQQQQNSYKSYIISIVLMLGCYAM